MNKDFRNTKYCPSLIDLTIKKIEVKSAILKAHPKAKNMYKYISDNKGPFKQLFIDVYNRKCSYCGVSLNIIGFKQFEIDHFIPKTSACFQTDSEAGTIDNLVLACFDCNRSKGNIELPDGDYCKVNPDGADICESFIRDEDYYIRINKGLSGDQSINHFYNTLHFDSQNHRLDYLLMNMYGTEINFEK